MARTPEPANAVPAPEVMKTDGAPRRSGLIATVVFALSTLALGFPALMGKFLVSVYSDQYKAGYAFREFAAATLKMLSGVPGLRAASR